MYYFAAYVVLLFLGVAFFKGRHKLPIDHYDKTYRANKARMNRTR